MNQEPSQARLGDETVRINSNTVIQKGHLIGDRYEVISRLGKGGMGLVYRVNQILLNKEFALKMIDKGSISELAIRRFQQEARTSFSLDHPSIVKVFDFGLLEDQVPFLVMELINGETLGERLKRTGCLTLEQAIPIFVQVCFGLAYAHECGIVHRDIKPNNIMLLKGLPLGAEGSVKIVDFGIAKFTGHDGGEIQALTRTGEIFGSPLYMSPEQCSGFRVDNRADIYALGCVLFEALTGTPPLMGQNALSTMMKHQGERAPTLKEASLGGDFPQAIEDIMATMLAKTPESRYQSIATVATDLGALKRGDTVSAMARHTGAEVQRLANSISVSKETFYSLVVGVPVVSFVIGGACGYFLHNTIDQNQIKPPLPEAEPNVSQTHSTVPNEDDIPLLSEDHLKKELLQQQSRGKQFTLNYGWKVTDKSLECIANASWIKSLSLEHCDISNEAFGRLAKLKLDSIHLAGSTFDDVGADALSVCQGLKEIGANQTKLSDEGIAKLRRIEGLKRISVSQTALTDKSLVEFAKFKNLDSLELKGVKKLTNAGLKALESSHIKDLNLNATSLDDTGLSYLSKMDSLNTICLTKTAVSREGVELLLRSHRNWQCVTLSDCPKIGPKKFHSLQDEFPKVSFL